MKQALAAMVIWMLASIPVLANEDVPTPSSIQDLEKRIQEILQKERVPGIGIALVARDRNLWVAGIGKADVENNVPVTADTMFRIGSTSKGFVSLSILKLAEEGRLQLDDPVHKWAPDVQFTNAWESTDPVRIVNVLEHTAGFDDLSLREYASNDPKPLTLKEGLELNPRSRTSRWRPGTMASYCNSGPAVAAYVVEKVTGQRFEDYVEENFFKPLSMTSATYFLTPTAEKRLTKLYRGDGTSTYSYWHIIMRPAGSINASAAEMANYVRMYLGRGTFDGKTLLQAASIERMERPVTDYAAKMGMTTGYGLSNYTTVYKGFVFHGHNGGVEGGLTDMAYLPDQGVGYVFMTNSGNGEAFDRIGKLVRNYLIRDLPKPALPPEATIPADLQQRYAGWYEPASPRNEMLHFLERLTGLARVSLAGNTLTLKPVLGKKKEFVPVTDRLLREKDAPVATLALIPAADQGTALQEDMDTYRRIPAALAVAEIAGTALTLAGMLSSLLFALIWIPRKLLRRMRGVSYLRLRAIPLVSTLSFAGVIVLFGIGGDDLQLLGNISAVSVGIFALSILFPLTAVWSLLLAFRVPQGVNRAVKWHSRMLAILNTVAAAYLAYWGVFALRTWA